MNEIGSNSQVAIVYTNWRGETGSRVIEPIKIWFGQTAWHKEDQWLLRAYDVQKQAERDFAIKDISKWSIVPVERGAGTAETTT